MSLESVLEEIVHNYEQMNRELRRLARMNNTSPEYSVRVYNNADFLHDSSGNFLSITLNSERRDTHGYHSTVTNTSRLTVPANCDGWYIISGGALFEANATGVRGLRVRLNGSTYIQEILLNNLGASFGTRVQITTQYYLSAGDYIELQAYQNSGGNLNVQVSNNISPEFMMAKVG
jgi:hypothetical protein